MRPRRLGLPGLLEVGDRAEQPGGVRVRGLAKSRFVAARSTTRPAYITATSSQVSATTPRSWVMSSTAIFRSVCSPRMSSRICAWMVTSSAVVGSSAISSSGSQASAIAIITRCRMPPESWCG